MGDPLPVGMQLNVIADTATERASRILHHHLVHPLIPPSPTNLAVRTGRYNERSAERPALAASLDPARQISACADLLPRFDFAWFGPAGELLSGCALDFLDSVRFIFESHSPISSSPPTYRQDAAAASTGSTSTSQFLEVGIPVPSVSDPINRHVGGPYGTKIIPRGTFPSWQRKVASPPYSDLTRTVPPDAMPRAFRSSGWKVMVLTMALYSSWSLPTLICWPCLLVRPAFMTKRIPAILDSRRHRVHQQRGFRPPTK